MYFEKFIKSNKNTNNIIGSVEPIDEAWDAGSYIKFINTSLAHFLKIYAQIGKMSAS